MFDKAIDKIEDGQEFVTLSIINVLVTAIVMLLLAQNLRLTDHEIVCLGVVVPLFVAFFQLELIDELVPDKPEATRVPNEEG